MTALTALTLSACSDSPAEKPADKEEITSKTTVNSAADWPKIKSPVAQIAAEEEKIKAMLAQMSVEEKVGQIIQAEIQYITPEDIKKYHLGSVLNGGGSMPNRNKHATPQEWLDMADAFYEASMDTSDGKLAIPIIWGSDAVHGHNNVIGATIFPHNIGLGAMRNPDLMQKIGRVTAREMRVTGIDWTFAPTLAVVQNDRWGRTYESYSEDPDVVKSYAGKVVYGLQGIPGSATFLDGEHVVSTAKHWLADGGTTNGTDQGNAEISESELRDIHAAGYITALEAGAQTAMVSFSSWNGKKMHGNGYLIKDVLKDQMGLDGLVVSDWNGHGQLPGCSNASCADAVNAGIDLVMVIEDWKAFYENTLQQVKDGIIPMERLDDAVTRILRVKLRAGLFEKGKPSDRALAGETELIGSAEHKAVAREAVRQSLVLLKNNDQLLPIKPGMTVLVAGDAADDIGKQSGGWTITWQGTGNENADFPGGQSIWQGLKEAIEAAGGTAILSETGETDQKVDVAIVVYGEEPYAESQGDRDTLEFEPQDKLGLPVLQALKAKGIPTVSVFLSGRPMWVAPEMNASDAFVAAWLPGSEGRGVADVLVADAKGAIRHDFVGKLSFSWPKRPDQDILNPHHDNYDPQFAYGYGLTYSDTVAVAALPEDVAGKLSATEKLIYQGRTRASWKAYVQVGSSRNVLSGAFAATANRGLTIETTDKDIQEDSLKLSWQDGVEGTIGIYAFAGNSFYNFTDMDEIKMEIKVETLADAPTLTYSLGCGHDCQLTVDLSDKVKGLVGKGWQTLTIPLSDFKVEESKLEKLTSPMILSASGKTVIQVSNIVARKNQETGE